jgi:hypothetical protein
LALRAAAQARVLMMMRTYVFEPDLTVEGRYYSYPLISWSSIFAGTLIAIALGAVFALAGLAIGAAAFNPFAFERAEDALTAGSALYAMFANLVAFQCAAYVAARAAPYPDHFGGALTGLMVWATASVIGIVLATIALSQIGGGGALTARVADVAGDVRAAQDTMDLAEAEAAADAAATAAWIGAAALAMGLAGAVAGGWLGAAHPKWAKRPRLEFGPSNILSR